MKNWHREIIFKNRQFFESTLKVKISFNLKTVIKERVQEMPSLVRQNLSSGSVSLSVISNKSNHTNDFWPGWLFDFWKNVFSLRLWHTYAVNVVITGQKGGKGVTQSLHMSHVLSVSEPIIYHWVRVKLVGALLTVTTLCIFTVELHLHPEQWWQQQAESPEACIWLSAWCVWFPLQTQREWMI